MKCFLIPTAHKKVPKEFASDNSVWCNVEDEKPSAGFVPV